MPPDLLTTLFANVEYHGRHTESEAMKKSPMLMQGAGGAIGVGGFLACGREGLLL